MLSCAGALSLDKGFCGLRSVLLTLAFMLLSGSRNPERLSYLQPGEFGALLGLARCPSVRTLRRRAKQLAQDPAALATWRNELAALWVEESQPQGTATLLVDGHVKTYGGKGRLPKQHVARQKLKLPGAASCWASALGGAPLAATRDIADLGWLPRQHQVGLTGRAISPKLYFSIGIRGAFEHTVGIRRAGTVVAINKNRKAPMFQNADIGIIGDYAEVVPLLTAALKQARPKT